MLIKGLVTVDVFYYIPQTLLVNEFIWQTEDVIPELHRVHQFLRFWKDNIDGAIKSVHVAYAYRSNWRRVEIEVS